MRRGAGAFVACAWMCAWSTAALAQADDTVLLRDGARVEGTVELYEPHRRVVVRLPDGTRRELTAGQFERVRFADEPASLPTPSAGRGGAGSG